MGYTLNKTPKVKYSPSEQKLFQMLAKNKKKTLSIRLLSYDFFGDSKEMPYHGETTVGNTLRSLRRKMKFNKEPFAIERVKQPGKMQVHWFLKTKTNGLEKR